MTGVNSAAVAVRTTVYADHPEATNFKFRVLVTSGAGTDMETTGQAEMVVLINQPPKDGNCSISPAHVSRSEIPFEVTCTGWQDDGVIQNYEIYGKLQ